MTITKLISQIDIKTAQNSKEILELELKNNNLKIAKKIVQEQCTHRNADGSTAFSEYAHNGHHSFERCQLCLMEVTV